MFGINRASRLEIGNDHHRSETTERMTGSQSRLLKVGTRICWRGDKNDQGTVTEKSWSGVTLKWDSRSHQSILHNDMDAVSIISKR